MKEKVVLKFSKKKARSKIYWLIFYVLIMLFASIIISSGSRDGGVFAFFVVFTIVILPQLIIHFNYLKHDRKKKVVFDYKKEVFQEFVGKKLKAETKISDIKQITHFKGEFDSYRSKLLYTSYHFYKICTEKEVFVFSEFLIDEEDFVLPNLDSVNVRFFNLMNLKNDYIIEKVRAEKKRIAEYKKVKERVKNDKIDENLRILKYIEQYDYKSNKELLNIIENKKSYQNEAVKAARLLLKGRG